MKELSIEQKAKAYDEAKQRAKHALDCDRTGLVSTDKSLIFSMFPDLAESEDEKIRKDVKRAISVALDYSYFDKETANNCLAWLEKQDSKTNPYSGVSFEYNGHVWGMCARDNGVDILLDKQLFKHLEKQSEQKPDWSYEDEANLNNIIWLCNNCINGSETTWIPSQATKIKHLIETIKERGLPQQKPAWSEEDDYNLQCMIAKVTSDIQKGNVGRNNELIDWLKSLKQRIGE